MPTACRGSTCRRPTRCRRWRPDVYKGLEKKGAHKALDDILESIAELRYYREHFLKV